MTVEADALVIATDVEAAVRGYGTREAEPIGRVTPEELRAIAGEGHFASGSMGPKVEAAIRFVEQGGQRSVITVDRIERPRAARRGRSSRRPAPPRGSKQQHRAASSRERE